MTDDARTSSLDRYLGAVDTSLLDLPWRERRQIRRDLREHLGEAGGEPSGVDPAEYAREIRASREPGAGAGTVRMSGLARIWPSPTEWLLNGLAGIAFVLSCFITWDVIDALLPASQGIGLVDAYRAALDANLPAPAIMGQNRFGLVIYPVGWVLGQVVAALTLREASTKRRAWAGGVAGALVFVLVVHVAVQVGG